MDIDRMRLGLAYIFKESSLGKNSRIQLLNFIENASMHQLKALALDGVLVRNKQLTEDVCDIVDERFDAATPIHEALKKASLAAVSELSPLAAAAIGAGASAVHRHKYCREKYGKDDQKRKKCLNDRSM